MLNIYKIIRRPKYVKLLFYKKISKNLSKVLCLFYLIWQILIIYIYIYIYIVEMWSPDNDVVVLSFIKLRKNKTFEALQWTPPQMLPSTLLSIVAIFIAITIVRDVKKTSHIDAQILFLDKPPWRLTGFYRQPKGHRKHESWRILRHLHARASLPWVCLRTTMKYCTLRKSKGVPRNPWLPC